MTRRAEALAFFRACWLSHLHRRYYGDLGRSCGWIG